MVRVFVVFVCVLLASCGGGSASAPTPVSPTNPPAISVTLDSSSLEFKARRYNNPPSAQTVSAAWTGPATTTIAVEAPAGQTQPDWLSITPSGTISPISVEFEILSTNLAPGTYSTTLTVAAKDGGGVTAATQTLDLSFEVQLSSESLRSMPDRIEHFGQDITLNGANIAWSADTGNWYNNDIGAVDGTGAPRTNITAFEGHFSTIANAGGNSARIWLHTAATVTPDIRFNGVVSGLSSNLTNEQVIAQITNILDAAWEESVLVTFNLFSFNMLCDANQPTAAKAMLEAQFQSYIDNALIPMVSGVKDHPALLAWEIFNEPEGMSQTDYFCPASQTVATETVQRVVNQAAAAIHKTDPNVKVTTSTHTELYDLYSNSTLLALQDADPAGTMDFYALHWYDTGWQVSPFVVPAQDFNADRPIVVGEYDVAGAGTGGPDAPNAVRAIFENGYKGSWPWSLTTGDVPAITGSIALASNLSTTIDKAAIEACLASKPTSCYIEN